MSRENTPFHQGDLDRYRRFIESIPTLVDMARTAARLEAYSYRGFVVGAAAEVIDHENQRPKYYSAGNSKPRHKAKFCAEQRLLGQIRPKSSENITGIVVAGTTDRKLIEGVTEVATPTLHPCADCRHAFDDLRHAHLVHDHMLVLTTGLTDEPNGDIFQVHTLKELVNYYAEDDYHALTEKVQSLDSVGERLTLYDHLRVGESTLKSHKRRPSWKLAKMALTADLAA